jgi:hypothetical protein
MLFSKLMAFLRDGTDWKPFHHDRSFSKCAAFICDNVLNLVPLQCCFQPRACQESKYNGLAQSCVPWACSESDTQVGVSFGETRELAFLHAKSGTKVHAIVIVNMFTSFPSLSLQLRVRFTFLRRMECCSVLVATVRSLFIILSLCS